MAVKKRKPSPRGDGRKRGTQADITTRVSVVTNLLLSGKRRADIVQYSAKKWHIAERQVDKYIAAATELIRAEANRSRDDLFNEHVARRREIFSRAVDRNDLRTALAAAQDEARLYDLYPSERHTIDARVQSAPSIVINIIEDAHAGSESDAETVSSPVSVRTQSGAV